MKATALTCRVFDQDVQLLIHGRLEWAILGILRLIGCHAAVRLGDKRVGDAARHIAPSSTGGVVGQQDHDADDRDVPLRTELLQDSDNNLNLTLSVTNPPVLGVVWLQVVVFGHEELPDL